MDTPATRTLAAVLRGAMESDGGALRMLTGSYAATQPTDLRYVNVVINGRQLTIPNLNAAAPIPGAVAYLLADQTRVWALGTVKGA